MIKIMSQRNVVQVLMEEPVNIHNLIFITSPNNPFATSGSEELSSLAKSFLLLGFDDVTVEGLGVCPREEHVVQALEFAHDKDDLIICCHAGISRSSAIAYTIATEREGSLKALDVLDVNIHYPNLLIVKYGSVLLRKPEMVEIMLDFHQRAREAQCVDEWDLAIDPATGQEWEV